MAEQKCPMCKGRGSLTVPERFGPRCAFERAKRGLSLRACSMEADVQFTTMSRIEKEEGRPMLSAALKLARFYKLKLEDFPDLVGDA